jgi:hypothetical protein
LGYHQHHLGWRRIVKNKHKRFIGYSIAPNPGTKRWLAEEKAFYKDDNIRFRCDVCREVALTEDGAADDMPGACSKCWVDARPVKVKSPYMQSQESIDAAQLAILEGDNVSARHHYCEAAMHQQVFVDGLRPLQVKTRAAFEQSIATLLRRAGALASS